MFVLLPPSETKRTGGEAPFDAASLRSSAELSEARAAVREALVALSAGDEDVAAKALKLGVKNRHEAQRNLELDSSGAMPAIERYTGVLYDSLDALSLDADARAWIDAHVLVQSALFGLISAHDLIPAYRLSGGSRLPALSTPLKRVWSAAHASLDWSSSGFVLDLRSKDYGALAPLDIEHGWFLHVVQRGADGEVRALNHFNKAAKGDLVRRLARSAPRIETLEAFTEWATQQQLEISSDDTARTITLVTELGAPAVRSGALQ